MVGVNSYFKLSIRTTGAFLELYPAVNGGMPLKFETIDDYLTRKKITYDKKAVADALTGLTEPKAVFLTKESVYKEDEAVRVTITEGRKEAVAVFFPPTEGGALLKKEEIVQELVKAGVKYGLQEETLQQFLEKREYCKEYLLAKQTPAIEGKSAEVKYYFNTDLSLKPKTLEDGSVDFHQLDMISSVKAGDLLAELIPAVPGRPGIDVCGNPIKPLKITQRILHQTNNVKISEDSLKMYASVNGHVTLVEDRVFVSDTYEVAADVDTSTGDIKCEGNVHVNGNVRTGFKIEAKGDVIVDGVVEGAEIIAGGQIIVKHGVQGMSRCRLIANGNIISRFIESAYVRSETGYVQSESIMHSKVSAKTDIIVDGKKGFISGGEVRCGQMISAKTIGSSMGTSTVLTVGIDPVLVEEHHKLEKEAADITKEQTSSMQIVAVLLKKMQSGEKLAPDKLLMLKDAKMKNDLGKKRLEEINARLNELQEAMEMKRSGMVKVYGVIYQGCKIVISDAVYYVKTEFQHARFVKDRADVKIESY